MGVGHIAVALGASKAVPRLNVGWLVLGALLSDFLLGIFASFGLEHATVPENYSTAHYLLFTFPYSHGLVAVALWGTLFGLVLSRAHGPNGNKIWIVATFVVLSHFLLDGVVHVAGLPLAGDSSPKFGLGLWKHLPLELTLETVMAFTGLIIYWRLSDSRKFARGRFGMSVFVLIVLAMTWSQLALSTPPGPQQLATSWILVPIVFSAIVYIFDFPRARQESFLASEGVHSPRLASKP